MEPPVPDVTPPDISDIVESNITDSRITITFDTNEITTGWVSYTQGFSCPCTDIYSQTSGTTHIVNVTGLAPDTFYTYEVKATDRAGNFQVGPAMSFRTLMTPPDTTPPAVSITNPLAGNTSGIVLVEAAATDNVAVAGVQFKVDGVNLGLEDVTFPYSISWDTNLVVDGVHTVTAVARDAANNTSTSSVGVNVLNDVVGGTPYYVDLDGVDDYAAVADTDSLSFTTGAADGPLTFELWFRPETMAGKQQLVSKWLDVPNQEYRLYINLGGIRLDLRDSSAAATISAYTTAPQSSLEGGWHHLAVTYDGRGGATAANGITFYVDGVAVALTRANHASYVAMENWTVPLQIGRESTSFRQYNGAFDELRIWNVARTQSQIQLQMGSELSGTEPGLVAYWRFNEGIGATVADDSPGGHPATLFNNPTWLSGGPMEPPVPE
jgi:chitodextrinase